MLTIVVDDVWLWVKFLGTQCNGCPMMIFRGQAKAEWPITSSFERSFLKPEWKTLDSTNALRVVDQTLRTREHQMMDTFVRDAWRYVKDDTSSGMSKVEWLSLMRHYGIPTRLVDFSESALVALYFALEDDDQHGDFAVWCMLRGVMDDIHSRTLLQEESAAHMETLDLPNIFGREAAEHVPLVNRWSLGRFLNIVEGVSANRMLAEALLGQGGNHSEVNDLGLGVLYVYPERRNARMSAQAGLMLMPTRLSRSFMDSIYGAFASGRQMSNIEVLLTSENMHNINCAEITKFVFKSEQRENARKLLKIANITPRTMYPDIDGVSQEFKLLWRDEYESWYAANTRLVDKTLDRKGRSFNGRT